MASTTVARSTAAAKQQPMKSKASKDAKAKKAKTHPTYYEMVKEAIVSLKERTGSSQYAIAKHIEEKQKADLPPNYKKLLLVQLKKLVASGKLVKVKNSFKLPAKTTSVSEKKPKESTKTGTVKPKKSTGTDKAKKSTGTDKAKKAKTAAKPKAAVKPKAAKSEKAVKSVAAKKAPVKSVKKPKTLKSPAKKVAAKKTKK